MAVTTSNVARIVAGNKRQRIVDVTGPASYTTGGETVTAAQYVAIGGVGATKATVVTTDSETNPAGYTVSHDGTNGKILFFLNGTQVSNATDLHLVTVRVTFTYGVHNAT